MHIPDNNKPALLHIVRDLRGDVVGQLDSPSAPSGLYPDIILQVASHLNDDNAQSSFQFFDLWELILTHWFPQREGYEVKHLWFIPYLQDREGADKITFVVLKDDQSPVVLLQVSAPRDFHNVHTRAAAEALTASQFEHVAPYCDYDHSLCAIAAMGKKWSAFQRSPRLTAEEARSLGEEHIEWMDDIVSEPSFEMLECFFASLKAGVRAYRLGQ
ncbi:hypothetical protein MIND_00039500 [Mycena indigotica]|uniref:Uncharacterized protein n=1 Tax=Mycena indigotica TaxID=2126181 RepID=A0A8H6TEH3_9AGAR|nr:uncharacterized protein MIND_00039500 [Mycena indigotica]KAF7315251.1 hypothetical protein MIND_00039500 [Mycena indigotica]